MLRFTIFFQLLERSRTFFSGHAEVKLPKKCFYKINNFPSLFDFEGLLEINSEAKMWKIHVRN